LPCAAQHQNFIVSLDSVISVFPNLGYDTHSWIFFFFSALFCFVPIFVAQFTVQGLRRLNFYFFFLSSFKLPWIILTFDWCYKFLFNSLQQLQFESIISGAGLTEHFKQVFKVCGRILHDCLAFPLVYRVFICISAVWLHRMRCYFCKL
jgi:hypothetical protein